MKILWMSNVAFTSEPIKTTGSWIMPMAEGIIKNDETAEIVNVSFGSTATPVRNVFHGHLAQWLIPKRKLGDHGQTAPGSVVEDARRIISEEAPDLIHVWGTETCWPSVVAALSPATPCLLEIQGVLSRCHDFYFGGLDAAERLKSIHTKEVIMPWRSLAGKKRVFYKRGQMELRYMQAFRHIDYQSEWVRNVLSYEAPHATLHPTMCMERDDFYDSTPWTYKGRTNSPMIFTSASGAIPYKGLHRVLQALSILKRHFPTAQLHIAGDMSIGNRLTDGFSIYLKQLIKRLQLTDNVVMLGPVTAKQIVAELENADACIVPSYIETYCHAFAEALMVGCPVVCSFAGAMPELAAGGSEALFYNPDDVMQCAALTERLIKDKDLAQRLSANARARRMKANDRNSVVARQIEIYKTVIQSEKSSSR